MSKRKNTKETSDDEGSDAGIDEIVEEEIMVDFELDSPKPIDFHAVKNLLSGLMGRGQNAALSGIADAVLEQDELTTVVRVSGDDEIFGFISVLNYHKYSNLEGVKQLKDFILQKAGEHKATLSTIFEDGNQSLGIILNERMFNVPPQLAFPLHNVLFGNINSQQSGGFKWYIMLTTYQTPQQTNAGAKKKTKKETDEAVYKKVEDEVYQKESLLHFTYPINYGDQTSRWTLAGEMVTVGLIMLIENIKIERVLQELKELLE